MGGLGEGGHQLGVAMEAMGPLYTPSGQGALIGGDLLGV